MNSSKAPARTQDEIDLENAQRTQIAEANGKANSSLKQLLYGGQGARVFTGSPLLRDGPSNTAAPTTAPDPFGRALKRPGVAGNGLGIDLLGASSGIGSWAGAGSGFNPSTMKLTNQ